MPDVVLDGGRVGRTYRIADGTVRTVSIRGDKGEVVVSGPEVAVVVDGVRYRDDDLVLTEPPKETDGTHLSWLLASVDRRVEVWVVVTAFPAAGVIRKGVVVTGHGRLDRVELELWEGVAVEGFTSIEPGPPPNVGSVELGQPVYGPGFFGGIEHPGAENLATTDGCRCTIAYGVELDPTASVITPTSVVGAGDFFDYLERIRPNPDRVVVLTNNWYHLGWPGTMSEATVRHEVVGFAAVTARHGLAVDHHCLDDGWDGGWAAASDLDELWARLDPARFPGGLAALDSPSAAPPASAPGRIGLWVGPFGGYGDRQRARVAWARERGGEVDEHGLLCVAGDAYRQALRETLTRWTAAGVRYWKLDGVRFTCAEAGHGHPAGEVGRTVQMDRFRQLLSDARLADPDVVLAFTSGSNPSPWWLTAADFLWRGGLDDSGAGYPGPRHESFATYIDARLHLYRRCSVPVSALVTFSVVESEACRYRDLDENISDWERHCWLLVGRGTQHHDLYVAPESLSEPEWAVLARTLAWARQQRRVLGRSRMVLGDPAAGEVYGFASRRHDEAVLCLRNPSPAAQVVRVVPSELLGFDAATPVDLALVFGPSPPPPTVIAGRSLDIELDPYEVLLLTATSTADRPASNPSAGLVAATVVPAEADNSTGRRQGLVPGHQQGAGGGRGGPIPWLAQLG